MIELIFQNNLLLRPKMLTVQIKFCLTKQCRIVLLSCLHKAYVYYIVLEKVVFSIHLLHGGDECAGERSFTSWWTCGGVECSWRVIYHKVVENVFLTNPLWKNGGECNSRPFVIGCWNVKLTNQPLLRVGDWWECSWRFIYYRVLVCV